MQVSPTPTDESRRLAALYDHQLLDTPTEEVFDAFARLAAQMCGVPIALITLIDRDRQWFKANVGLGGVTQVDRELSFCASTVNGHDLVEIENLETDARFTTNPLVAGPEHMRFYAGAPLVTTDGYTLGTLCVMDRKPGRLTPDQRRGLRLIADAVMGEFEARRALLRLFDSGSHELYHFDVETERIVFASEAARANLGYDLADLRKLDLSAVLPNLQQPGVFARRMRELRDNPQRRMTLRTVARRANGTSYPLELQLELVRTQRREIVMAFGTDLTKQKTADERIALLSAAVGAADDGVLIARPGATIDDPAIVEYANPAFLRQKMMTLDDVVGKSTEQFYGPKTDFAALRDLRAKLDRGESVHSQLCTYRSDGSFYYTDLAVHPLRDADGKTTHLVSIQRDVTQTVTHGVLLETQNQRLLALTTIARGIFSSLEPTELVAALVNGVRELVGAKARLLVARPNGGFALTRDLSVPARAVSAGDDFIMRAAESDGPVLSDDAHRVAQRIVGPNGGTRHVLDARSETALDTTDLFAFGLLAQYFAVAARNVELYGELQTRRAAVLELNQVKNDLIAMLAHDFKGPLTTIVGFADVLAEDERFDDESRKFLAMISSSAMRLASLATDTLALSRLEQNEFALSIEEFDVLELARDVVRVFSVTRTIDLRTEADRLPIAGDPPRLRQVFENLIGNAIKYSPSGAPVDVTVRRVPNGVEVAVRDRGIGIPEGDMAKLFGRFARAENARAMGISGTGFGLYLTKTIVDMHGGTIRVESREGSGSTFTVFVPAEAAVQRQRNRRFILIDSDGDARSYVAHTLRDEGSFATVVANGAEMLAHIDESRYDAALVDIAYLDMKPHDFVRRVAGRAALVRIDGSTPSDLEGWSAHVRKPYLMKDLQAAIATALANVPDAPKSELSFSSAAGS